MLVFVDNKHEKGIDSGLKNNIRGLNCLKLAIKNYYELVAQEAAKWAY